MGFCSKCGAWKGSLGLEPTPELFIKHLCDIYDEVYRVLRKDGTCFVNLGDTFSSTQAGNKTPCGIQQRSPDEIQAKAIHKRHIGTTQPKSLIGIPEMFALEMQRRGWIRRNTIIWFKRNCMPSSARDRFTVDFEYIYFFTKSKKYWFEQQFEAQQPSESSLKRYNSTPRKERKNTEPMVKDFPHEAFILPQGRNARCVWDIPPRPYPEAHFATYPQQLCERPIAAGCPEFVCKECGEARCKILERESFDRDTPYAGSKAASQDKNFSQRRLSMGVKKGRELGYPHDNPQAPIKFKGYTSCACENPEYIGGVVLDPFSGSGTTGAEAIRQGKRYIGIDISEKYTIDFAVPRLEKAIRDRKLQEQILELKF
jgi:DNA modification methylase